MGAYKTEKIQPPVLKLEAPTTPTHAIKKHVEDREDVLSPVDFTYDENLPLLDRNKPVSHIMELKGRDGKEQIEILG